MIVMLAFWRALGSVASALVSLESSARSLLLRRSRDADPCTKARARGWRHEEGIAYTEGAGSLLLVNAHLQLGPHREGNSDGLSTHEPAPRRPWQGGTYSLTDCGHTEETQQRPARRASHAA